MKRKIIAIILACLMAFTAFCLTGCTTEKAEPQKLIVGFDAEFPPFGYVADDGSYDGFDLAMAEELCKRLGWEFTATPIHWNSKDSELASGAINCIWNGFTYTGRETEYEWSTPYVDNSIVLVVKTDAGITSLADLAGKSVMAQKASSAADAIDANEEFKASLKEVIQLDDYNTGFMELEAGTVDAVAADLGVATFNVADKGADKYVILTDDPIQKEQYAVGFLKGNTELRDAVDAELLKMAEDGTMMTIAKKYEDKGLVLDSLCLVDRTTEKAEPQKLIVGFDAEFPPFGYVADDGSYDGFDLAMAEELCKRLGWEFTATPIHWNSKDTELASGAINCIWNGFTYTGRETEYEWSTPYVDNSIVLVVKTDAGITSLADLAGKSVMAQKASSAADAIDGNEEFKASLKEVIQLDDYNTGFMELEAGTVDAVAADLGVATFNVADKGADKYVILTDDPIQKEQYAVGFLKGNTELRDAVDAELLKMAEDGTMMTIAKKYEDKGLVLDSLCLCK